MRAKELYQQYVERSTSMSEKDNLCIVADYLIDEIHALIKSRGCKYDSATFSVLDEVIQKWKAFARLAGMNEDFLMLVLDHLMPEVMVEYRRIRKIPASVTVTQKGYRK